MHACWLIGLFVYFFVCLFVVCFFAVCLVIWLFGCLVVCLFGCLVVCVCIFTRPSWRADWYLLWGDQRAEVSAH